MSPKVQGFQGPGVPRSQGPKDHDISNSHSNTSLTLKKVHLVPIYFANISKSCYLQYNFALKLVLLLKSFPKFG